MSTAENINGIWRDGLHLINRLKRRALKEDFPHEYSRPQRLPCVSVNSRIGYPVTAMCVATLRSTARDDTSEVAASNVSHGSARHHWPNIRFCGPWRRARQQWEMFRLDMIVDFFGPQMRPSSNTTGDVSAPINTSLLKRSIPTHARKVGSTRMGRLIVSARRIGC